MKKDKYGIFKGFLNKELAVFLIYRLYEDKYTVPLQDFFLQMITEDEIKKILNDKEKQLDITLNYLYPLLKEGKLKVRLTKKQELVKTESGQIYYKPILVKEYKNEEAKQAIDEIKSFWILCKNDEERNFFVMRRVEFTLSENEWFY